MTASTAHQLVVFSLPNEEYALPIGDVDGIIRFAEPRSVAPEAAWIRGVIGLRGKIIPIFGLAARLGPEPTDPGKIVVVSSDAGQVGVMVDEVAEVLTVEAGRLEELPTADGESIEAIAKEGDRLSVRLDTGGVFAREVADDLGRQGFHVLATAGLAGQLPPLGALAAALTREAA